jgi:hypothetical protein
MDLAEGDDQIQILQDLLSVDPGREATDLERGGHSGSQFR